MEINTIIRAIKNKFYRRIDYSKSLDQDTKDFMNYVYYYTGGGYFKYFGIETIKYPTDLMIYQEIINEIRPDVIIETGTYKGGSALYFAHLLDVLKRGIVITIDIKDSSLAKHKRILHLLGRSDKKEILEDLKDVCKDKKVLVILDATHDYKSVLNELKNYSKFVSLNSYIIVEDTNINGHPVEKHFGKGAYEAVEEFMKDNKEFEIDKTKERFILTANPNGFLRRVK